jgi:hypothetical protein
MKNSVIGPKRRNKGEAAFFDAFATGIPAFARDGPETRQNVAFSTYIAGVPRAL